jgi:hypothetical protein
MRYERNELNTFVCCDVNCNSTIMRLNLEARCISHPDAVVSVHLYAGHMPVLCSNVICVVFIITGY